jgi:hypothetical protein
MAVLLRADLPISVVFEAKLVPLNLDKVPDFGVASRSIKLL